MSDRSEDNPEGLKVGNNYIVGQFIAKGSFGRIHRGKNLKNNEEVAIKLEPQETTEPQLVLEFSFYRKLKAEGTAPQRGIPKIHTFGPCGKFHALVMDLFGPSIENVHKECGLKFSLKTTIYLVNQMLELFEYFHGKGLIYRDTKPDNFLFGRSGTKDYMIVHMTDLGLCKDYLDDEGKHLSFSTGKGVIGTVRYMSINNHNGVQQSRRDDMEALGYMWVFLLKGQLPWMGVSADTIRQKYKLIGEKKKSTSPDVLCADIPQEFAKYLKEVRELDFEAKPKYKEYTQMFSRLFKKSGLTNDKVTGGSIEGPVVKLRHFSIAVLKEIFVVYSHQISPYAVLHIESQQIFVKKVLLFDRMD
ncbi:unnamed protein product [Oppiella nova]|uniref:Protein kinase domain-containing protein n=1 Tax=Oppiella nova TaxID=334625 RepID=A0A7R9LPM8_9ACAR|nr:unnamed protein product [Oppiella nova]CAG2165726.1 unnamed protein product [Oppiella nova]